MTPVPSSNLQSPNSKRRDFAAILFIAALVLLFFWRIITPRLEDRAIFPPGDFSDQFWMFRVYEARAFGEGRLPLWSENFNSGHPFLADIQSAIFYPISLIWTLGVVAMRGADFTLLDLEIEALFHFMLAGAFTYLFAKRLLVLPIPALLSALTFTFGGYLTSYPPQQLAILETATWLPLILLLLDYAIERGTRYYIAAGIFLGIAMLAGHPQTFLFVGYTATIFFAWRVYTLRNTPHANRFTLYVVRFILVTLIALCVSAAQWIPTLEYQTVSTRAALTWSQAAGGFPTLDPLQMILPGYASAFQSPLYIGVVSLWLAIFALLIHCTREKNFWVWLAFGSLIVSFGYYAFAYAMFYLFVPGFAMFRGQERLALVISFSLAILAGYGMRELMSTIDVKRARRTWALLPAGVVVSLLMLALMFTAAREYQTGRMFFLTDRAAFMVLLFILSSTVIASRFLSAPRKPWGWVLVLALLLFDLFSINNIAYNADNKPRFPPSSIIETILTDSDIFRVAIQAKLPGHSGIAYNLEEIDGISPLRIARYDALKDLPDEQRWTLLNVRYVIANRSDNVHGELVQSDGDAKLFRLNSTLPRAWLVGFAEIADDATALAAMQNDTFHPQAIAYVASALPFPLVPNGAFTPITFQEHTPERFQLSFRTPTDELLVLSEIYYPGWRATVDGVETPILRADVTLRAIPVRAGTHIVELIYDPWSVKLGLAITALTVLFAIGSFLFLR